MAKQEKPRFYIFSFLNANMNGAQDSHAFRIFDTLVPVLNTTLTVDISKRLRRITSTCGRQPSNTAVMWVA